MNEPSTIIYTGLIIIFALPFIYAGYYFVRNTIKQRNWAMFLYAGAMALIIACFAFYIYRWF